MPWNATMMVLMANAARTAATHMQIHTGDPGPNGINNVSTAARKPINWAAATGDGDFGLSGSILFTGGAANGPATHVSFWSALTSGTHYGSHALTGDTTFSAAGEYTVTAANIDGSST